MAEASTTSDTYPDSKKHARSPSDASISCHRTSKRLRTNSSKTLERPEPLHLPSPEIVYERRRVNPESLAIRLGPELVSELNALIIPGNRDMPSFAVRKELQERYNIDRRHLYDYFHSKGLRVVKEDKNGNPIRQTDQSTAVPQVTSRLLRQAPPKTRMLVHDSLSISSDTRRKVPKSTPKPRVPKQPALRLEKSADASRTVDAHCPPSQLSVETQYSQEQQGYFQFQPTTPTSFVPSHYFTNPLQNYFVFDSDATKAEMVNETPSPSSTPVFEKMVKQEQIEPRLLYPSPEKLDLGSISQRSKMRMDRQFMSQEERTAFYDFIDNVLGPASGAQESVGTYKAYMAEQSRLYFERILPGSHDHMRKVQAQTYVRSQTTSQSQVQSSTDSFDFRKWLVPEGLTDSSLDNQRNSVSHFYSYGTRVSEVPTGESRSGRSGISKPTPCGEDDLAWTLDDLFPEAKDRSPPIDEAFGSPIERSMTHDSSVTLEHWKDYMVDEDDIAISPTLVADSPSTQQASPDVEFCPVIQTPAPVYQQFIQEKIPHSGFVYTSQTLNGTLALQNDPDMRLQHFPTTQYANLRFQDDRVTRKSPSEDVVTEYKTPISNIHDTVCPALHHSKSPKIARASTKSYSTRIARVRTSSARGGI